MVSKKVIHLILNIYIYIYIYIFIYIYNIKFTNKCCIVNQGLAELL